jgi:hypothetical protein
MTAAIMPQSLPPKSGCFVTASRVMCALHMFIVLVLLFSISTAMAFAIRNITSANRHK